ncbi:MAG: amidohydrolase family protein [Gemmatimonadota bacterium]
MRSTRLRRIATVFIPGTLLLLSCDRAQSSGDTPATQGAAAEATTGATTVAFTHVTVVDVERGQLLADQTVLVQSDRIAAVGLDRDVTVPAGADVVDGTGRFLVPGFADMHVHLYTVGDLFTYVANGITTVRNMAGDSTHLAMRAGVSSGRIIGPRIITAGPVVEAAPLSHPDNVLLDSPAAVRRELLRQQRAGYDFVKVYNELARPVYDSVVRVARELGLPVAGHVPASVGIDGALAARQGSIEHFRGYIQALMPSSAPALSASFRERSVAWNRIDDARMAPLVARTVAAGVWNVPTFAFTVHELSPDAAHKRLLARPEVQMLSLQGLPKDRATTGYLREFTDADYAGTQRGLAAQFRLLRALDGAGAGLLVGTDSWLAGYAFADELELLVRAGLSPARVLRMATVDAARYLGEERESGTVAGGRRADLVLLDANPLADIGNVRRVQAVMLRGRLLRRDQIDSGLAALPRNRQQLP